MRANTQATSDLKNATEDYETVLREISKAKFDNVAEQFENVIGHIDNALDDLSNSISDIENRGLLADATLYEAQIDVHNKILAKLESEHTKLKNQLQNIKEQTTEWYEALEAIQDVENSIAETNASIKEMRDAITEIASTLNDNIVDSFHTINDESDLLLTLLGNNLTDSDIGGFTDEGIAALALYSNQLNVAKTTAEKLLSEINSVQNALENGTYGDFIDANGMNMQFASAYEAEAYIEELYAKYRDEINSTYTYESNIIDLMKEKYAAEIDYIKELIDQKKELLDAEKDLYEYSKNIKEQTDNIDSLRKQIAALSGDTSLETSARIQKLQSQLKDAQEELSDTEYERYISDQQDMLDNLYAEYEELVTSLEKDTDALLQEGLQLITQNSAGIQETIRSVASDNNYQMTSIMDSNISTISQGFSVVENLLNEIVSHMKGEYEGISGNTSTGTTTDTSSVLSHNIDFSVLRDSISSRTDRQIVDVLSNGNPINDNSELTKAIESVYGSGISRHQMAELSSLLGLNYTLSDFMGNSAAQAKEDLLNALIEKGYIKKSSNTIQGFSNGGVVSLKDAVKLNDDTVLVSANPGERMLTEQQNEYWEKWTNTIPDLVNLADFVKPITSIPDVIPTQNRNVGTNITYGGNNEIHFDFPNVMNYNDFCREAQKDPRFEQMIQCMAGSGLSSDISKFKKRSIRF